MNRRLFWQRIVDVALFAATMAAVAASFFDALPEWSTLVALISFVILFFVRWWMADDRKGWMKSNWFDLALVIILSSPFLRMLVALRLVHLLPALKLGAVIRSNKERLLRLLVLSSESLPAAMAVMLGIVFVFGTTTYLLEHSHNPQFGQLPDGLWWAFVTLTTVGYGDVVPVTPGGRVMAVMTMVLGIVVYSLMIANLTVFLEEYGQKFAKAEDTNEEISANAAEDTGESRPESP